jgi:hypothetical protein
MSEKPPEKDEKTEPDIETESSTKEKRIVILQERDIPFEEERPPNFSPHFEVKVHRIRKPSEEEDQRE